METQLLTVRMLNQLKCLLGKQIIGLNAGSALLLPHKSALIFSDYVAFQTDTNEFLKLTLNFCDNDSGNDLTYFSDINFSQNLIFESNSFRLDSVQFLVKEIRIFKSNSDEDFKAENSILFQSFANAKILLYQTNGNNLIEMYTSELEIGERLKFLTQTNEII